MHSAASAVNSDMLEGEEGSCQADITILLLGESLVWVTAASGANVA